MLIIFNKCNVPILLFHESCSVLGKLTSNDFKHTVAWHSGYHTTFICSTWLFLPFPSEPEYKRARQEIKKKSSDTLKLQKKAKKGKKKKIQFLLLKGNLICQNTAKCGEPANVESLVLIILYPQTSNILPTENENQSTFTVHSKQHLIIFCASIKIAYYRDSFWFHLTTWSFASEKYLSQLSENLFTFSSWKANK